jgi:diguanylate cyclase (GGDEF)-like protein
MDEQIMSGNPNPYDTEGVHGDCGPIVGQNSNEELYHCDACGAMAEQIQRLTRQNLQLTETNTRFEDLSRLDPLTEVLNRRGFQEVLTRECQYAQREGQYFIVLLVDLDNFKQINDSMGYDAGDFVLKEVARRLCGKLRATDYVARIGGDEFMILLPKTFPAEGSEVAQKVRLAVSETILWRTGTISVTISIGLAMVKNPIRSINELLAKTHIALVKSKEGGKNQVAFDSKEDEERWQKKQAFARGLDLLRQGEDLLVVWQPIVKLDTSEIVGYEFFSRSPLSGFEMPDDFFHLASEANMLAFFDRLCFEKCVQSTLPFNPSLQCHINLFPTTLLAMPVEDLLAVLPADRRPRNYCIELSERWFVGNTVEFVRAVHRIRAEGVLIAVDDVGFGHTFLESLILLNPDRIKIDSLCTNGIAKNETKRRALERLLKIIRTLGSDIMVKGVESEEDIAILREMGVQFGQGHFFKIPVSPA